MAHYISNVTPIIDGIQTKKKDVTITSKGKSKCPVCKFKFRINTWPIATQNL